MSEGTISHMAAQIFLFSNSDIQHVTSQDIQFSLSLALCYFVLVFSVLLALRLPRLEKRS